ncbi:MAG: molybdenum cofactor biosynthesis protein MoaE [Verrucomicrobia bacterium]|nr:MAG: molybdenum cofactor biosynthesis protein MoaE [Verrucomicrobiota bacterium]
MFFLSDEPIRADEARTQLANQEAGALVIFEGWVRDHNDGRSVKGLDYEAFKPLAEKEGCRILAEARDSFPVLSVTCVHRIGSLALGDLAVWVGVTARHRDAAFDACRYVIDEVKKRVPIWKKEHYSEGVSGWVNADENPGAKL